MPAWNHDFKKSLEDWEADRWQRLDKLGAEYEMGKENCTGKEDLEFCVKQEQEARAELKQAAVGPAVKQRYRDAKGELADASAELAGLLRDLEKAEKRLKAAKQSEFCLTCGQRIKDQDHSNHLDIIKAELVTLTKKLDLQTEETEAARERRDRALDDLEEAEDLEVAARRKLEASVIKTDEAKRAYRDEVARFDHLEEQMERIEKEVNPFQAMEAASRKDIQHIRDELQEVRDQLADSQRRYSIFSMWVRSFKDLRLQLIAEALTELEIEVNSSVAALGLLDWELKFQVDRETKSGTLQRGFNVLVRSPHNQLTVPWEAWSGGEAQRLRIAGNMGLADLIRSRTGAGLNLEVWDEPTQGLSVQGQQDLLEALAHRAETENRCIWLVDHSSHAFGGFAGGATIIKTEAGSVIRQI